MSENKSPLASRQTYLNFKLDEYNSASIISYEVASLPPSKFSQDKSKKPSVRFCFAGFVPDEDGAPTVVRKWTSWVAISYNEKSSLSKLFKTIANLEGLLTDDEKLFGTPFAIFVEPSKDGKYSNITRVKLSDDTSTLSIPYTGKIKLPDGTETFAPYKKVMAYGNPVYLELHVNREADGIKSYTANDFIENPPENEQ